MVPACSARKNTPPSVSILLLELRRIVLSFKDFLIGLSVRESCSRIIVLNRRHGFLSRTFAAGTRRCNSGRQPERPSAGSGWKMECRSDSGTPFSYLQEHKTRLGKMPGAEYSIGHARQVEAPCGRAARRESRVCAGRPQGSGTCDATGNAAGGGSASHRA